MESSDFLISNYIKDNYDNDIESLRKKLLLNGIFTKDYKNDNILLLYNKYNNKNKSELEKECRSIILNRTNFEILCYTCNTPICNTEAMNYLLKNSNINKEIYKCYEGTLLSLFYFNNKWYLSTRRCLDSNNSLWNDISHYDMFNDILKSEHSTFDDFTSKLNKNYCYYFILIHHKNKNIVNYEKTFGKNYMKLCLAFIRENKTQNEISVNDFNNIYKNIFLPEKLNNLESFDKNNQNYKIDEEPETEGIVIKIKLNNKYKLLKLQTLNYQFHTSMGNNKNTFLGLIYLYQNNKLVEFINNNNNFEKFKKIVNPINTHESYDTLGIIDAIFKVFTSELFNLFITLWDLKTLEHKNKELYNILPSEYKKILFKIKGIYYKLKSKKLKLRLKNIYELLKSTSCIEIEKLLRSRKLMFNLVKMKQNNQELKLFNKISEKSDKVHLKLIAIFTNILFPEIMPDDIPNI